MEVLAAIGLAGSIVEFVDCGIRWISTTAELYTSTAGALEENIEAEKVAEDLRVIFQGTQAGTRYAGDQRLQDLLLVCSKLADDLKILLTSLKMNNQKNHKLESFRKSFKVMRQKRST